MNTYGRTGVKSTVGANKRRFGVFSVPLTPAKKVRYFPPLPYEDDEAAATKLPDIDCNQLQTSTPHELDSSITFEEKGHKYTVRYTASREEWTSSDVKSVSGIVKQYFSEFNKSKVIFEMRRRKKFKTSIYRDMTDGEIAAFWDKNSSMASHRGTLLHLLLECDQNGVDISKYHHLPDIKAYLLWKKTEFEGKGLVPFRTELRMRTGIDLRVTGMLDLLAISKTHPPPEECDGVLSLHLIDWKFSKEIKKESGFEKGTGPCAHLDNCNLWHYSLQQNMYQWMIETYYPKWTWKGKKYTNVRIVSKHLAVFHKNHKPNGCEYLRLKDMQEEVLHMMRLRSEEMTRAHGPVDAESGDHLVPVQSTLVMGDT